MLRFTLKAFRFFRGISAASDIETQRKKTFAGKHFIYGTIKAVYNLSEISSIPAAFCKFDDFVVKFMKFSLICGTITRVSYKLVDFI